MINIDLPAKTTWGITRSFVVETTSGYDVEYARILCILAKRSTRNLDKQQLRLHTANLYDTILNVTSHQRSNALIIRYSLSAIRDQYLPTNIKSLCLELFAELMLKKDYTPQEVITAVDEIKLYNNQLFESNEYISELQLSHLLFPDNILSEEMIKDFYSSFVVDDFLKWLNKLDLSNNYDFSYNHTNVKFKQLFVPFEYKISKPIATKGIQIDKGSSQGNIAIAYQLPTKERIINNVINLILGGDVFSKLFKIIREEQGLSYNISSYLFANDILVIKGGVNIDKVAQVVLEVETIIEYMAQGDFGSELELAKIKYIENIRRSINHEAFHLKNYTDNYLLHENLNSTKIIEKIENCDINVISDHIQGIKKIGQVIVK